MSVDARKARFDIMAIPFDDPAGRNLIFGSYGARLFEHVISDKKNGTFCLFMRDQTLIDMLWWHNE